MAENLTPPVEKETPPVEEKKKIQKIPTEQRLNKKKEFEVFLDLLRGESAHHWTQIANTLGVDQGTITSWKKLPQAQKAIRDGIEKALEGMTEAGSNDWRMWESKVKMLGLSPIERQDITSKGEKINGFNYQPPVKTDDPNSKADTQTA